MCSTNYCVWVTSLDSVDPFTSLAEPFKSSARCLGIGIDSSGFRKQVIIDHRSEGVKLSRRIIIEEETGVYNDLKYPK